MTLIACAAESCRSRAIRFRSSATADDDAEEDRARREPVVGRGSDVHGEDAGDDRRRLAQPTACALVGRHEEQRGGRAERRTERIAEPVLERARRGHEGERPERPAPAREQREAGEGRERDPQRVERSARAAVGEHRQREREGEHRDHRVGRDRPSLRRGCGRERHLDPRVTSRPARESSRGRISVLPRGDAQVPPPGRFAEVSPLLA
jgi:hypothetical protein